MKKIFLIALYFFTAIFFTNIATAQTSPKEMPALAPKDPWTFRDLISPARLDFIITHPQSKIPVIFNIGAVEDIRDAAHIGPVSEQANMEKFEEVLRTLPKNKPIVIYCGCCPFAKCPNIRPAFEELKSEGFTDIQLLDLPQNLETNWIKKGYSMPGQNVK